MSTEAMDWALELAPPMPAQLVATLSGLARHADKKGRGAYPSVARLAAYTCKAERSVQRDLKQLRDLGLIRLGDQSKAAHLPEGKRPEVYDLALERVVPGGRAGSDEVTRASRVTLTSSRRRGGQKTSSDGTWGDVHVTGDVDVTGDADDTPDVGVTPRPPHRSANGKRGSSEGAGTLGTGDVDVTPDVHVTGDVDVADGVTSTSPKPKDEPNYKRETHTSRANTRASAASGATSDERNYHWPAFGEFWVYYPNCMQPEKTKRAWRDALDRGADPGHIVKAAKAYADHLGGKANRFTPYSATWLNNGSYDDPLPASPEAPAVNGGPQHQTYDTEEFYRGFAS